VLEQPPHEIRKQMRVAADRCVDTAATRDIRAARAARAARHARTLAQRRVKLLAHAVQTLQLERPIAADLEHPGDRVRVVRRELRVEMRTVEQQTARAGEISDVGVDLAREDRESVEPLLLRALDL